MNTSSDDQVELTQNWAEEHLISNDEESPLFEIYEDVDNQKSKFGVEAVIYSAALSNNLLVSLIDGVAAPAKFKYADLMKSVSEVSSNELCYWVRINEPDNCLAVIEEVWEHTWDEDYSQDYQLEELERGPAAEGGCSYLCLLPASKAWVLVHELNPGNNFTISVHANEGFRDQVLALLNVEEANDVRNS